MLAAALLAALLGAAPAAAQSPDLVVSQVYGGGGNANATFTHDFVEIFNRGDVGVALGGKSLQYASATGTGNFGANSTQLTELPAVTLDPGQYMLVQQFSQAAVGSPLPTPNFADPTAINMSGTAGKVAIANDTTTLGCNGGSDPCTPDERARIIDFVGYGGADFFEGPAPAPELSNTSAAFRAANGCQDTDDNAADFTGGHAGAAHCGHGPGIVRRRRGARPAVEHPGERRRRRRVRRQRHRHVQRAGRRRRRAVRAELRDQRRSDAGGLRWADPFTLEPAGASLAARSAWSP